MLTGICEIRFIVIQINTLINLGHGVKKANALILKYRWLFVSLLRVIKAALLNVADRTYGMFND